MSTREQRRQAREERRKRRAERRQKNTTKQQRREADAAARDRMLPARKNSDPLKVYDRNKKPASLRDIYRGCSMFMVCGGPSINAVDYMRLRERGVVSLGVNNIAGKVPVDIFTASDPPEKFAHQIWLDPKILKLVPIMKRNHNIRLKVGEEFVRSPFRTADCPNVFFYERSCVFRAHDFLTSESATWGNNNKGVELTGDQKLLFTFFLGLRLCHYLGAVNVFLLGVDFDMSPDNLSKPAYAFGQDKHQGGRKSNMNSYRKAARWCAQLRPIFEQAGFNVFNCNPESKLEVWPYVGFEKALAICKGSYCNEEVDLEDWYKKIGKDGSRIDG